MKILVVATGGTIGSVKNDKIGLDKNVLKILDYCNRDDVAFVGVDLMHVLSENICINDWKMLVDYLDKVDFSLYDGVVVLHGSDTLAYTSAIIGNAFWDKSIALVASDKPVEDSDSNAIKNFNMAVDSIKNSINSPIVCYDRVYSAIGISSAGADDKFVGIDCSIDPICSRTIFDKNILVIKAYPNMDMSAYCLDNVDAVLVDMFHSATVPASMVGFAKSCKKPVYFVTQKSSADYETASDITNFIFNSTIENAFARLLLTK